MSTRTRTKQRMIDGATSLMRTHGYTGTSFKDVWESTGTPRGSVYFHFPDGKAALGLEVIRSALHTLLGWTDEARVESGSAVDFVERLAEKPAGFLERTGYEQGCPIAAIAIEQPSGHPELREAASHAFSAWSARIAEAYARFGVPESDCPDLALATASALEGAIAISKADGSSRALHVTAKLIGRAVSPSA